MPDYENPEAAASQAAEAARALAHGTRDVTDPAGTYGMLGSLSAALASLRQSLDQLASWHERHAGLAVTDDGDRAAGARHASAAAASLREAARRVGWADPYLSEAFNHNGQIAWQQAPAVSPDHPAPGRGKTVPGRLAPTGAFGASPASRPGPEAPSR